MKAIIDYEALRQQLQQNEVLVLGCDPGFATFGMAMAGVHVETLVVRPLALQLVVSKKDPSKTVRVSSDDVKRIQIVSAAVNRAAGVADILMSEIPSGGAKSHSAAKAMAYATAILAATHRPLVQVSPLEVKTAATGDKHASKKEMIAWGRELYSDINWTGTLRDEHLADALAAIHAGIETEQFLATTALFHSLAGTTGRAA